MSWSIYLDQIREKAEADRLECRRKGFVFLDFPFDGNLHSKDIDIIRQEDVPFPVRSYGFLNARAHSLTGSIDFHIESARFTPRGRR